MSHQQDCCPRHRYMIEKLKHIAPTQDAKARLSYDVRFASIACLSFTGIHTGSELLPTNRITWDMVCAHAENRWPGVMVPKLL